MLGAPGLLPAGQTGVPAPGQAGYQAPVAGWTTNQLQIGGASSSSGPIVSASGSGGGDGADHYATGRLPDALDADHEIQAWLVYWKLRKHARSIREWLEKYFAGDKSGASYLALYTMAVNGDEELERWYIAYGI